MNKIISKAAVVFLAIGTPSLACAEYSVPAQVGGRASDTTIDNTGKADHQIDHDLGFDVGIVVGYEKPFFRAEVELNSRNGDVHRIDGENAREGDYSGYSAMANFYLDFDNSSPVTPFVGGERERLSIDDLRSDSVTTGDESDPTEAWQLMARAAVDLDSRTSLDLTYRYLDCNELNWAGATIDYTVNSFAVGLRYSF